MFSSFAVGYFVGLIGYLKLFTVKETGSVKRIWIIIFIPVRMFLGIMVYI
jgi:hypothetical protein